MLRAWLRRLLGLLQLVQSHLVLRLRCLLELVILLLPAAVPGVPGSMQRQVDSRSHGRQRRSPSGGFDWRDVSQVEVSFTCAFFSSSGKYYRSSSVFRGYGSGFLPPTSGRSFIRGASAWFCPLLRLTAVSLACGLAFAVFCGGGGFPRGIDGRLSSSPSGVRGLLRLLYPRCLLHRPVFRSIMAYSRLYFG